jgi:DNA processing protein
LSHSDLLARIRLIRSQSIGPVTFRQLLARFGSAEAALRAVPDLAAQGGGRMPALCSEEQAERERARVEALGGRYLSLGQGLYPALLAQSDNAPRC